MNKIEPVVAAENYLGKLAKQRSLSQAIQMIESNQQHVRAMHIAHLRRLSKNENIFFR